MKKIIEKIIITLIIFITFILISIVSFATNNTTVYIDNNGIDKKYHRLNCSFIPKNYTAISVEKAFEEGYRRCPICEPVESDTEKKLEEDEYKERYEEAKEIINNVSSSTITTSNDTDTRIVYVTSTGSKYHLAGCDKLDSTPHSLTVTQANSKGYAPCKKCNSYNLADDFYKNTFNPNILLFIIFVMFIILIIISLCFPSKKVPNTNIKGDKR